MAWEVIYIKADRSYQVKQDQVLMGDVLHIEAREELREKIRKLPLHRFENKQQRVVISILSIIDKIQKLCPEALVENIGESDVILTREEPEESHWLWNLLKTGFAAAIVFWGSAFTIMTYHNDVGITDTFQQIYLIFSGTKHQSGILEWMYSLGLGLGILIFYHHFTRKRMEKDPTPMEIEMNQYENDLDMSIIENNR